MYGLTLSILCLFVARRQLERSVTARAVSARVNPCVCRYEYIYIQIDRYIDIHIHIRVHPFYIMFVCRQLERSVTALTVSARVNPCVCRYIYIYIYI